MESKCLFYERKLRKNNIVVFGLDNVNKSDLAEYTLEKLNKALDLNFKINDVNNVYKIGRSEKPPVVVEFISYLKKIEIFKDIEKLRTLKGKGISVSNDLCKADRENQKILRKHLKIARSQNQQVRLKGNKLEIEGVLYTVEDLEGGAETDSSDTDSDTSVSEDDHIETAENITVGDGQKVSEGLRPKKKKRKNRKRKIADIKTPSPQNARTTRSHKKKKK